MYSVRPYPEKKNHPSFVNISPTLVIDASMERSSRVLQHENTFFLFKKFEIDEIKFFPYPVKKNTLASSISVLH